MAKGASLEEAQRLKKLKEEGEKAAKNMHPREYTAKDQDIGTDKNPRKENSNDDNDHDDDDDDALLEEYRTRRRMQLQRGHGNDVIPISRTEWNRQVNEASLKQWVVILLTSTSSAPNLHPYHLDICHKVERDIVPNLASKFEEVKWVSIPSTNAIENWPDDNLPTLFCYRRGKLQCQLVGLDEFGGRGAGSAAGAAHKKNFVTEEGVEYRLGKLGVLDTDIDVDPDSVVATSATSFGTNRNSNHMATKSSISNYGRSKFQGGMATFATNDEGLSDYDDVD